MRLIRVGEIRRFILGGNATFTVVFDGDTGRRTYKVKSWKIDRDSNWTVNNQDKSKYWVSLRTGPGDSFMDYKTIGVLKLDMLDVLYVFEGNGKMPNAERMFESFWKPLEIGCSFKSDWEFWHEGQCCICGKPLTVPESIERGIGPDCWEKMGF